MAKISFIVTMLIYMLLFITNLVSNGNWLFHAFAIATFEFVLLWLGIVICTAFTNPFCEKILNIVSQVDNTNNIIIAFLLVIVAIIISVKKFLNKKV